MISITARALQSNTARRHTIIVHTLPAADASAATRPRVDQTIRSHRHIAGFGARGDDSAIGFMAQGRRQIYSALAHGQTLATAQLEIAVSDMRVTVAYAAVLELEQHLSTFGLRRLALSFLKRLAPLDDVVAQHIETIP